MVYNH